MSLLTPNEVFITQSTENLSYDDSNRRFDILFGITCESDLNKSKMLALSAVTSINRILKIPKPKCLFMEFGDSTVNLELRIWIDDPKNGIHNDKDAALMAVWDSFQASGIEIAFPQRDLHIKSTVPLEISQNSLRPLAKNSPTNWYRSPDIRVL